MKEKGKYSWKNVSHFPLKIKLFSVVIRLGSEYVFSSEMIELQEEVKPLWKVPSCPRVFKRTSVERTFRDAGFALDWCSFRLVMYFHYF